MEEKPRWGLLSKRNILGAVLAVGIVAGVYLSDFLKGLGFGLGPGSPSTAKQTGSSTSSSTTQSEPNSLNTQPATEDIAAGTGEPLTVVKVIIANRSYSLRTADGEQQVDLARIVEMAKSARGDDDGIKVRIYRKPTSRAKSETELQEALLAAGIDEKEFVFMPTPVEE